MKFYLLSFFVHFALAFPIAHLVAEELPTSSNNPKEMIQLEPPVKEIVKITEHGFVPQKITLRKLDSSVFFVNTTKESLATIAIDFGERRIHCSSGNLKLENGIMRSQKPIPPRDFDLTCFPEAGTYKVALYGVGQAPFHGLITVE